MIYILDRQKIQVNIVDADTKQLIQKNIMRDLESGFFGGSLVDLFKDGVGFIDILYASDSQFTIKFVESQITALGYNFNSITGNVVKSSIDPETGIYMYPWVVNVYMSKL